ncbi:hypothetical protein FQN49_001882 [Arthroderma sp. PD_2]|nr:hypothetical protein FQN49_001882 [Arthroderma sp. PD_2]
MAPTLTHTDSLEAQDPNNQKNEKKQKSRRPANTAFRQQRLKAWQPILTPKTVLPIFFVMGIIFAPIGGLLIYASSQVEELVFNYSNCNDTDAYHHYGQEAAQDARMNVQASFKTQSNSSTPYQWYTENVTMPLGPGVEYNGTRCSLIFNIPNDIGPPVYMYYRLTNFYQNHRRYVKSLDLDQMRGVAVPNGTISTGTCDPLRIDDKTQKAYYPCGLIANSMFNDTFSSPKPVGGSDKDIYEMTNKGISWSSDKDLYKPTKYTHDQVVPPQNWKARYPDGYTEENPPPNVQDWEELQVWMRTAGLPTFSKLAMRNKENVPMKAGTYQVDIDNNFFVSIFGGTKSMVITTRSVMGGKNPFLGIAYVVVGGLCILLGTIFTFVHLVKPRKLGDHRYLTWNSEQDPSGTTTGAAVAPKSFFNFRRRG